MSFLGTFLGTDLAPGAASANLFAGILALAAGRPVFTADFYVVDGGSGKVRSWVDQSDPTHILDQSNTARQVAVPVPHADYGGQLCATFNDTGLYLSNRAPSAWKFCHDGTGFSTYFSCTPLEAPATANRFLYGTHSAAAGPFFLVLAVNAASTLRAELNDGTVGIYAQTVNIAANTATWLSLHYATSRSPDALLKLKGATASDTDLTGPTNPADPRGTLLFGANVSFGNLGRFRWRHMFFFPLLDGTGQTTVETYITSDSGIAA